MGCVGVAVEDCEELLSLLLTAGFEESPSAANAEMDKVRVRASAERIAAVFLSFMNETTFLLMLFIEYGAKQGTS